MGLRKTTLQLVACLSLITFFVACEGANFQEDSKAVNGQKGVRENAENAEDTEDTEDTRAPHVATKKPDTELDQDEILKPDAKVHIGDTELDDAESSAPSEGLACADGDPVVISDCVTEKRVVLAQDEGTSVTVIICERSDGSSQTLDSDYTTKCTKPDADLDSNY